MSIFNNEYPVNSTFSYTDFDTNQRAAVKFNNGNVITFGNVDTVFSGKTPSYNSSLFYTGTITEKLFIGDGARFKLQTKKNNALDNQPTIFSLSKNNLLPNSRANADRLQWSLSTNWYSLNSYSKLKELVSFKVLSSWLKTTENNPEPSDPNKPDLCLPILEVRTKKVFHGEETKTTILGYIDADGYINYDLRKIKDVLFIKFTLKETSRYTITNSVKAIHAISLIVNPSNKER